MRSPLALFLALLLAAPALPQTPPTAPASAGDHTLTLRDAEELALRNNPQITISALRALESREFVRETRSAFLPQATLNLTGVGSEAGSRIAAGGLTNPAVYPRAAAGASVTQLITDFGRTRNLLESSASLANAADQNAVATRRQILLAVDQAFYNSLETNALLHVAEETVRERQVRVDQVRALTDAKLKSDLDLSFVSLDLSRARLLLLDARNNHESSLAVLSALLGYADRQEFALVEPATDTAPPPPDPASLIQQALQLRPEILSLQQEVSAATSFGKAEHDLWRPTVNAAGVVGLAPVRDPHIDSWYGAAGVNVSIPVFNGFLFNARSHAADLETDLKRKQLQSLQDNVARDVRSSWLDSGTAFERLDVTRQLREQASLALDLASARYKLGLSSIVEFTQAELQKTEAELQDTDAHYRYLLSKLVLQYQVGTSR